MKGHPFVRELTAAERQESEAGLVRKQAIVLRRCRALRASACGGRIGPTAQKVA
jgi:hypothetical protein